MECRTAALGCPLRVARRGLVSAASFWLLELAVQPIFQRDIRSYYDATSQNAVDQLLSQLRNTRQLLAWLRAGKTVELRERNRVIAHIIPCVAVKDSKTQHSKDKR
jgi:hypothetical protein